MENAMKCFLSNAALIPLVMLFLTGCQQDSRNKILKKIPAKYTLSYKQIVYVENDGSCDIGQVIKVIGGKRSKGIPRRYECVSRPQ
ncbi:MAG: DUF6719 family protein [Candidatus Electrothrix sp. GW3-4]|uniref:DUF6719 family protein n=1 Tax=Candidatus Electrothrix sp. GW3-4 TaxID=3126740 RepID=UPI0030CE514A